MFRRKKLKCIICNKKIQDHFEEVFRCKCGNMYCIEHKYKHDCKVTYEKKQPDVKVVAEKVSII